MQSIELKGEKGVIKYFKYKGNQLKKTACIVLPNGYGALDYIHSLAEELLNNTSYVYIPIFRGQEGNPGELNVDGGANDLALIFDAIRFSENHNVNLICHCSSLLYLQNIKKQNPIWDLVTKVIVYSFLYEPDKHFKRFEKKSKVYGVKMNQSIEQLEKTDYTNFLQNIPVPLHIIHPKTKLNRFRANALALDKISKLPNIKSIVQPNIGYEIEPSYQKKEIQHIIEHYYEPLLS